MLARDGLRVFRLGHRQDRLLVEEELREDYRRPGRAQHCPG